MKEFNYELIKNLKADGETVGMIAEIYEHKGRQNFFISQKSVILESLVKIAKIQSTEASNKIEGIVTTEKRMIELLKEKSKPKNRDEEEILGYRDVLNTIHENYEYITIRPNIILQLHRDLYKYSPTAIGGKYKSTNNTIQEIDEKGNKFVRFQPLESYLTPEAIDNICKQYDQAVNLYKIEPLLIIPIFIHDFLCVHPFSDGNGRMSRLLTLLLLYKSGFFVGKYISIEKMIEKTKERYYDVLQESSFGWHENVNDTISFTKYMLQIILAAYREFEKRIVTVSELNKSEQVKQIFDTKIGKITKKNIKELLPNISESMIEVTLRELLKSGYIEKIGNGRHTVYINAHIHNQFFGNIQ